MMISRGLFAAVVIASGCGPLEIGSYAPVERDAQGGATAQGGETSAAGTVPFGAGNRSGGASNQGPAGSAGFGGYAAGGDSGSPASGFAGGGFSPGGSAGHDAGGTSGTASDGTGGAGFAGLGNASGSGGSGGGFAGSDSGGSSGGGSGGSAGTSSVVDRSCRGLEGQCSEHFNCCVSRYVDTEQFVLGWDEFAVDARVTKFYVDELEVTVGRFARFVEAFEDWRALGNPGAGAGEHTFIQGTGWQADWTLPESREVLEEGLTSCPFVTTYSLRDTAPEVPMNCVSWFEAFAFCIWDGKRLLTEAEWELVAKGGAEDRVYPWGNDPEPTPDHAVYGCFAAGLGAPHCEAADLLPVGSKPLGNSWHGVSDMAGSVAEWVFDREGPYASPCLDCATTESEANPTLRMFRGGGYSSGPPVLATERRNTMEENGRLDFLGFRCARSLLW